MVKRIILGIIIFTVLFSLSVQRQAFLSFDDNIELVKMTFLNTGAKYEYANINAWTKINNDFTPFYKINEYIEIAIKNMNINRQKTKISRIEENNFRQVEVEYTENTRHINIAVQSLKNGSKSETYMLIDEYLINGYDNALKEKELINNTFKILKLKPKVTVCFVGTFKGKLNKEKNSSIVKLVLDKLHAQKVEGMEDENIISVSAYSSKLKEYIKLGSEKINLNVAIRYSSFDDKTYLWVATPIIAIEY
ncbi:YwmB family TATA-box binding protein [Thermoanaerobacter uzonensis]|uniref:YwmB family TATA-box binding protein n=1 Tax=Thermoanaerobacter uzonensis TaxID=447593 RepID=UPI003D767D48